jgi:ElaB/YqjD/DUF883 family membrane-anchored ribosome-binding protein
MQQQTQSLGTQVRNDIETSLSSRHADPHTSARRFEDKIKREAAKAWSVLKRHPYTTVGGVAALGVLAAATVGVAELTFGVLIAYAAFNVFHGNEKPSQAVGEIIKELEHV